MKESVAMEKKERGSKWLGSYRFKRIMVYVAITAIVLIMPFITVDGNHLFLLNFDKKQLHLLFVQFDMQELYLMPFLLLLLFLGIFFMTTLGGRVWCGWSCPQTIFRVIYRDMIETKLLGLRKNIQNKQKEPDMSLAANKAKKVLAIVLWTILSVVAAANFIWYFIPPEDFFSYIQNPTEHGVLLGFWGGIVAFLVYDIIFLKENFCVYICPYARVQSVMYDDDTFQTVYDYNRGGHIYDEKGNKLYTKQKELLSVEPSAECTACESCVRVCPTHIDIRKGMQLECINCLECVDACTKVMGALGKESLVRWTSYHAIDSGERTRVLRFRIVAYMVALTIVLAGLVFMSTKKEHMLLNINRVSELYSIKEDRVENAYTFLFQNTDSKDHEYFFEVSNPDIKVQRPDKPFKLKAGSKSKKIVVLETRKVLVKDERRDTPLPIIIKAYAVDDKEKIFVTRDTVFVYPRWDLLPANIKQGE